MGEAKRRKQLGLMPSEERFAFRVERGGPPAWGDVSGALTAPTSRLPSPELQADLAQVIGHTFGNSPGSWASQYRAVVVEHAEREYVTRAEIGAIPVPDHLRGVAVIVRNVQGALDSPRKMRKYNLLQHGGHVYFESLETSSDELSWTPRLKAVNRLRLARHRGLRDEPGDTRQVGFTLWRDRRIELSGTEGLDPAVTEALEREMLDWYGKTPEEWDDVYHEHLSYFGPAELTEEDIEAAPAPVARRATLLLVADDYVLPAFQFYAFGIPGFHVNISNDDEQVSFDGQTWETLPSETDAGAYDAGSSGPRLLLTAWKDGRVEWETTDPTELELGTAQAERLRSLVRRYLGQGPQWDDDGRQMLLDYYGGELAEKLGEDGPPADERLPVLEAIRLSLNLDDLQRVQKLPPTSEAELDLFAASVEEHSYSLTGQTWHPIADEAPPELAEYVRSH